MGTIVKLLRGSKHHGFPVVARGGGGGAGEQRVIGVILRDQLCTLLKRRQFEGRRAPSPSPHLNMRERGRIRAHRKCSETNPKCSEGLWRVRHTEELEPSAAERTLRRRRHLEAHLWRADGGAHVGRCEVSHLR